MGQQTLEFWVQKRSANFWRISKCLPVIFSKYFQMSLLSHPELGICSMNLEGPDPGLGGDFSDFQSPGGCLRNVPPFQLVSA